MNKSTIDDELPRSVRQGKEFFLPTDARYFENPKHSFFSAMRWMMSREPVRMPTDAEARAAVSYRSVADVNAMITQPPAVGETATAAPAADSAPKITWLGHSSLLVSAEGLHVLTDPVWAERASPVSFAGPQRHVPSPLPLDRMPVVHAVVISHSHYDHLDEGTVRALARQDPVFVVPTGLGENMTSWGCRHVVEVDWWDQVSLRLPTHVDPSDTSMRATPHVRYAHRGSLANVTPDAEGNRLQAPPRGGLELAFAPTQHWTSRTMFDKNTSLWGCHLIAAPRHRVLFGGDTAYTHIFSLIARALGPIDCALMPIGAYRPVWFMRPAHCTPAEVVRMHKDMGAGMTVGIHWGTFPLGDDNYIEPGLELARARELAGLGPDAVCTAGMGETFTVGQAPRFDCAVSNADAFTSYLAGADELWAKETAEIEKHSS